uniref:ADP-ribosyl cyclase/cyclic ADP-ribose hydrolase n=1 Tax=Fagus sylvatica TaxID=28930 RepID=A0A2N9G1W6_FAGSY
MGKTTLARVVYGMVSNQFEACSFIVDVREVYEKAGKDGLLQLQKQILNELLMERDVNIHDVDNGVLMIKNRLRHKKILLVLDDVNKLGHLKKLAGEHGWFGPGSRVIITTRDKQLLVTHSVNEIYEVEALDDDEALQLFSLKAFKKDHPAEYYAELSQAFVSYAKGLPLAIEVLGSFLFNRSIDEWKCELDRLKEFPKRDILDGTKAVQGIVLNLFEPKKVDWNPEGFSKMQYLKLLKISGVQLIHDLKHLPNSLRYLDWSGCPLKSLPSSFQSNELIELCMRYSNIERLWKGTKSFEKLKFIYLDSSHKLIETPDFTEIPNLEELLLKDVDISGCSKFERLPENLGNAESVEELDVSGTAIRHVPSSIGRLKNLKGLSFRGCKGLSSSNKSWYELIPFYSKPISPDPVGLSPLLGLCSLTNLNLSDCNLKAIPNDIEGCKSLEMFPDLSGPNAGLDRQHPQCLSDPEMYIVIPGSEIPEWFSHQSMGPEVNIKLHYSHLCNDFMGIALCAVFGSDGTPHININCIFIVNGNEIGSPVLQVKITTIASDHILLSYRSTTYLKDRFSKSLVEYDANGFCQIGIRFENDYWDTETLGSTKEVKKCGVRLLYKKDIEDPIPTDSDSTVLAEGNKVKRRRDEYDGAGPSGEGSSNDVPHPKRIERPTEFGNSDSEESSEYKDCDEELSDVQ